MTLYYNTLHYTTLQYNNNSNNNNNNKLYKSNFRQYGQMKSRDGKSQQREEKKKKYQKRESLRRTKIQVHEKVGKSRNIVFFQWFVAPDGLKVGSLKRRVRSHLARRCGAKHISKSKRTKQVGMSKKRTPV